MAKRLEKVAFALLAATTAFLLGAPLVRASVGDVEPLPIVSAEPIEAAMEPASTGGEDGVAPVDADGTEAEPTPGVEEIAVGGGHESEQGDETAAPGTNLNDGSAEGAPHPEGEIEGESQAEDEGVNAPVNTPEGSSKGTTEGEEAELPSASEIETLAATGTLTLARLNDLAPMQLTGGTVSKGHFTATKVVVKEGGRLATEPITDDEWAKMCGSWTGATSGVQNEEALKAYPQIANYKIGSLTINGSEVARLGNVSVKTEGDEESKYVYWSPSADLSNMTSTVLAPGEKIQVNYVMQEYPITYKVLEKQADGGYITSTQKLADIFGLQRPAETVNQWLTVDVTVPAGYYGRVYMAMAPTDSFQENNPTAGEEKFPQ